MAAFAQYIGNTIAFEYKGERRMAWVEKANECGNGKVTLTCKDLNKNMAYRQFDVTQMSGIILIVE